MNTPPLVTGCLSISTTLTVLVEPVRSSTGPEIVEARAAKFSAAPKVRIAIVINFFMFLCPFIDLEFEGFCCERIITNVVNKPVRFCLLTRKYLSLHRVRGNIWTRRQHHGRKIIKAGLCLCFQVRLLFVAQGSSGQSHRLELGLLVFKNLHFDPRVLGESRAVNVHVVSPDASNPRAPVRYDRPGLRSNQITKARAGPAD